MAALEFKFSSDKQHQLEAIEATCDLFRGQQFIGSVFSADSGRKVQTAIGELMVGHGNELRVAPGQLLDNLHAVQEDGCLPATDVLSDGRLRDFTVEMETGTGKTYLIKTLAQLLDEPLAISAATTLTQAGYVMIVIDQSEEMLCVVRDKAEQLGLSGKLLLLQQDLLKLDLYGTIRGAVSTFDSFNLIPDLDTAIANAAFFMEEGGVFLFDMNTPSKHQKVLGENVFTFEEEDAACVWRNHYHPADRRVEITVDIDYRETGEHFHEQFYEYTYDLDTIRAALEKHGFVLEKVCDGESFGSLIDESERYFFCAVKQYTQLEENENV